MQDNQGDISTLINDKEFPLFHCDLNFTVCGVNHYISNAKLPINISDNLYDFSVSNHNILTKALAKLKQGFPFSSPDFVFNLMKTNAIFYPIMKDRQLDSIICFFDSDFEQKDFERPPYFPYRMYQKFKVPNIRIMNLLASVANKLEQFEQYEDLETLNQVAKNCYQMLKCSISMSEYYKLVNNEVVFNIRKHSLNHYLDELLKTLQVLLLNSGYKIKYELCSETIICEFDEDYLSMALFQIISNSCAFSPKDSTIQISLKRYKDSANISISDEGIGIRKEDMDKIFDPFFSNPRLNQPIELNNPGLGLPIAKRIVEKMDGSIIVKSEINCGTSFGISLPIIENDISSLNLHSNTQKYFTNRFSTMYIYFSDVCNIVFF